MGWANHGRPAVRLLYLHWTILTDQWASGEYDTTWHEKIVWVFITWRNREGQDLSLHPRLWYFRM
jgi:hypothetical protein